VFGALLVLALFAVIGVRGFRVAMRHPDVFASLLVASCGVYSRQRRVSVFASDAFLFNELV
jgi:cell division protein FtsW (lipid II flippase)